MPKFETIWGKDKFENLIQLICVTGFYQTIEHSSDKILYFTTTMILNFFNTLMIFDFDEQPDK